MSKRIQEKTKDEIPNDSNKRSVNEKKDITSDKVNKKDITKELESKTLILEMIKETIFPALKSRIEYLEEQLSIKDQKLESIKLRLELTEMELDSPLPLPI